MQIFAPEDLQLGWLVTKSDSAGFTASFIIKGSFQFKHNGIAEPLEEPIILSGEIFNQGIGEKLEGSLRYETDLAPLNQGPIFSSLVPAILLPKDRLQHAMSRLA